MNEQQMTNPLPSSSSSASSEAGSSYAVTQTQKTFSQQTPKWIVALLLLVFPPAAWYIMWKEKQYHRWFSVIIMIYSCALLLTIVNFVLFVAPQMLKMYQDMEIPNHFAPYIYPAVICLIAFSIIQIGYSLYIKRYVEKYGELSTNLLVITVAILILGYLFYSLVPGIMSILIMNPLYSILN